jgi:hypothetical protein
MWRALGDYFRDPRLRQLFGRYATYCGSSPFQAPATLMLVAHVEQEGVWLVEGGMHRLAVALEGLAERRGATFRYGAEAAEILVAGGKVAGVRLASGERLDADAVVLNADVAAVAAGRFGPAAAGAVPKVPRSSRSLSAVTWALHARTEGFPWSATTSSSPTPTKPSSTTSSGALDCPQRPPSTSAPRTAMTGMVHHPTAPSASYASSTPRPRATPTPSTPRRSRDARSRRSGSWNGAA